MKHHTNFVLEKNNLQQHLALLPSVQHAPCSIGFYPCTYCRHTNQTRVEWQNIGQDRRNSTLLSVNMTIVAHDAKFWPEIEFVKKRVVKSYIGILSKDRDFIFYVLILT